MTFSTHPLSYCSNVHPGLSVDEVQRGLTEFTRPVRENAGDLAAGLWLAQPVIEELLTTAGRLDQFVGFLQDSGLTCYTFNAFPYGNFHDTRVKENVYLPDWTRDSRWRYTLDCARVLARLLPPEIDWGSLSTVPLGFKEFPQPVDFQDQCAQRLIDLAQNLSKLRDETGRTIRLAIEPEPFCVLETTDETLDFFQRLRKLAADRNSLDEVYDFIGVCYDVCHQSVEFEDVADSLRRLEAADIAINKVHISCAIRVEHPAENEDTRRALARYAEPRYLHQMLGRTADGTIHRLVDLTEENALHPNADFASADEWRIHFHVPVNAESLGPLQTTRPDLRTALATVKDLADCPHLEVETYTWEVLPGAEKPSLVDGLSEELRATQQLLDEL
ncbi:TIM barrel protein [bacterium]|nr:TIM barrel protein [bacterium]